VSSKFVNKFKRELKKSPAKAGVLATLCVVALWFWLPLVLNLFSDPAKKPDGTLAATPTVVANPSVPGPNAKPVELGTTYSWKQLSEAIERDPRMRPAATVLSRDVFQWKSKEPVKVEEEPNVVAAPVELDVAPAAAGIVLTSTMVSSSQRVARLSGKNYRVGDKVETSFDSRPLEYRVASIKDREVWLTLGKNSYELIMPRKGQTTKSNTNASVSSDSPDFDPSWLEQ